MLQLVRRSLGGSARILTGSNSESGPRRAHSLPRLTHPHAQRKLRSCAVSAASAASSAAAESLAVRERSLCRGSLGLQLACALLDAEKAGHVTDHV